MQCARTFTSIQRSLSASQAISLALRHDALPDAYHILNNNTLPPASRRLPAHVLLHGLIRRGLTREASSLSEQMMRAGIKPRTRSLETLFTSLARSGAQQQPSPPPPPPPTRTTRRETPKRPSAVLSIHHAHAHAAAGSSSSAPTRHALRLLLLARRSRQRRTHRMFRALFALCLVNGEIILASLIFGVLVRDWQGRVLLAEQQQQQQQQADDPAEEDQEKNVEERRVRRVYDTPFPAWSHLNDMLAYIDHTLSSTQNHHHHEDSVQALANLAHLLDERVLPIGGLAGLVRTMYKTPFGDVKVWVWARKRKRKRWKECGDEDEGEGEEVEVEVEGEEVNAQRYFHAVLKRLACQLPSIRSSAGSSSREYAPAPLTLQTYNTLLHYSLAHAKSRRMADAVMRRLVGDGHEPSGVTVNVIESAALRSRVVDRGWAEGWKARLGLGLCVEEEEEGNEVGELRRIGARYAKVKRGGVDENENYALCARIGAIVSRGRPEAVVRALPSLLPGLMRTRGRGRWRCDDLAVRRARVYGPVVLTAMLSAVMKTGKTGLAEEVWGVMKAAERLSWVTVEEEEGGRRVLSPWSLGVEAYTVMIRVYGKEARKGAGYDGRECGGEGEKTMVVGWGKMVGRGWGRQRGGRRLKTRVRVGRLMGMKMYREGLEAASVARARFEELCGRVGREVRVVGKQVFGMRGPDGRFFNAILDVVARKPGMRARSRVGLTRRRARARLAMKRRKYAWEGRVVSGGVVPDVRLSEVVRDMKRIGIEVPLIVKRLLVGRDVDMDGIENGREGRVWVN